MIKFLSNWVQNISIAVVIASIFELILPNGNIKKYIKVVLGIYVVFCIISPFCNASLWNNLDNTNLEEYIENIAIPTSTNYDENGIEKIYIEEFEENIKKYILDKGYKVIKCTVDANLTTQNDQGVHKISLILEKNDDSQKIENININIKENNVNNEYNPVKSNEIDNLRKELSNYYKLSEKIIYIDIK